MVSFPSASSSGWLPLTSKLTLSALVNEIVKSALPINPPTFTTGSLVEVWVVPVVTLSNWYNPPVTSSPVFCEPVDNAFNENSPFPVSSPKPSPKYILLLTLIFWWTIKFLIRETGLTPPIRETVLKFALPMYPPKYKSFNDWLALLFPAFSTSAPSIVKLIPDKVSSIKLLMPKFKGKVSPSVMLVCPIKKPKLKELLIFPGVVYSLLT